jgi:hypothetical protein
VFLKALSRDNGFSKGHLSQIFGDWTEFLFDDAILKGQFLVEEGGNFLGIQISLVCLFDFLCEF